MILISCDKTEKLELEEPNFLNKSMQNNSMQSSFCPGNVNNPYDSIGFWIVDAFLHIADSVYEYNQTGEEKFFDDLDVALSLYLPSEYPEVTHTQEVENYLQDFSLVFGVANSIEEFKNEFILIEDDIILNASIDNETKEALLMLLSSARFLVSYVDIANFDDGGEGIILLASFFESWDACMNSELNDIFNNPVKTFQFLLAPPISFAWVAGGCLFGAIELGENEEFQFNPDTIIDFYDNCTIN